MKTKSRYQVITKRNLNMIGKPNPRIANSESAKQPGGNDSSVVGIGLSQHGQKDLLMSLSSYLTSVSLDLLDLLNLLASE
jgi:hypothetical protein